jgi:hypothetical protein
VAREAKLRKFEADTYTWHEYDNMSKALCKHIIAAVNNVYIKAKNSRVAAYNKVTVNQLLVHLFTQYGDINPNDIADNDKWFSKLWDGVELFENISKQFDDCIKFAQAALLPYTMAQIMNQATLVVYNTGLFYEDLKKWDNIPAATKPMNHSAITFVKHSRYTTDNNKPANRADTGLRFKRSTTWQKTLPTWQKSIEWRKRPLIWLSKTSSRALTMQGKILARLNLPPVNFAKIPATGAPSNAATWQPKRVPVDKGSYCWLYGYLVTKNHASTNCIFPKDGH